MPEMRWCYSRHTPGPGSRACRTFYLGETTPADHPAMPLIPSLCKNAAARWKTRARLLQAYSSIIDHVHDHADQLAGTSVRISALDCVVDWDDHRDGTCFLTWPMASACRCKAFHGSTCPCFCAQRLVKDGPEGKEFRQLCALLVESEGFRWVMALSTRDKKIEPAFVSTTSDPGWHAVFKTSSPWFP